MDKINILFDEIKAIYNENTSLNKKILELQKDNEKYTQEIILLKCELEKKPSIKPSVSLWENSQNLINEKLIYFLLPFQQSKSYL